MIFTKKQLSRLAFLYEICLSQVRNKDQKCTSKCDKQTEMTWIQTSLMHNINHRVIGTDFRLTKIWFSVVINNLLYFWPNNLAEFDPKVNWLCKISWNPTEFNFIVACLCQSKVRLKLLLVLFSDWFSKEIRLGFFFVKNRESPFIIKGTDVHWQTDLSMDILTLLKSELNGGC